MDDRSVTSTCPHTRPSPHAATDTYPSDNTYTVRGSEPKTRKTRSMRNVMREGQQTTDPAPPRAHVHGGVLARRVKYLQAQRRLRRFATDLRSRRRPWAPYPSDPSDTPPASTRPRFHTHHAPTPPDTARPHARRPRHGVTSAGPRNRFREKFKKLIPTTNQIAIGK